MLIMRPYQIYAAEAILKQAQEHPEENGYIWHTTGSGKTITSFKASQLLSRETDATKVIFMIDRSDLDLQTAKNFNSYLPKSVSNQPALDRTENTYSLVRQLQSNDSPLIITTIQKLNNAVSGSRYKDVLTPFHDQRVIFIEDEAHRSQFGEMRKKISINGLKMQNILDLPGHQFLRKKMLGLTVELPKLCMIKSCINI